MVYQLVKSVDWGDTWSNLFRFSSRVDSAIVLGDDSILVNAPNGDIFRSIDGGTNFSLVFSPSAGSATHWCPMDTYDKFVFLLLILIARRKFSCQMIMAKKIVGRDTTCKKDLV